MILATLEVQWDLVLALKVIVGDDLKEYALIAIDDDKYSGLEHFQPFRSKLNFPP